MRIDLAMLPKFLFQSTLPARGATKIEILQFFEHEISIHAPREGSDERETLYHYKYHKFQSTLPARGATRLTAITNKISRFQSTLPARGATLQKVPVFDDLAFQSTLPARGATDRC